jgi:hypothetical protein
MNRNSKAWLDSAQFLNKWRAKKTVTMIDTIDTDEFAAFVNGQCKQEIVAGLTLGCTFGIFLGIVTTVLAVDAARDFTDRMRITTQREIVVTEPILTIPVQSRPVKTVSISPEPPAPMRAAMVQPVPIAPPLTPGQAEAKKFIQARINAGHVPTLREIQRHLGWRSTDSVRLALRRLEDAGELPAGFSRRVG